MVAANGPSNGPIRRPATDEPAEEGTAGAGTGRPGRGRRGSDRVARLAAGTSLALAVALGVSVAGPGPFGPSDAAAATGLTAFGDCDEFTDHMAAITQPQVGPYGLTGPYRGGPTRPVPAEAQKSAAPATDAGRTDGALGNGPTGTNIQERGVDEPDVAKVTDGRLVTVDGAKLHVVDVSGPEPERLGRLALPDQYASELLAVDGDRALVIGSAFDRPERASTSEGGDAARPTPAGSPTVVLTLIDLANPRKPAVLGGERITGRYVSARLSHDIARIVLSSGPRLQFSFPRQGEDPAAAAARNRDVVREAEPADWLPGHRVFDGDGDVVAQGPLMDCTEVRRPVDPSGVGIISVLTIDTTAADSPAERSRAPGALAEGSATGVVGTGDLVYASPDRLYVATTEGGRPAPGPLPADGRGGSPTRGDGRVTRIHAFGAGAGARTPYLASGAVEGYLLGRWAMSEHDGLLRVATTTGQPWARDPQARPDTRSGVVVLDERGHRLVSVGRVSGLGKGERIYSVRWFGDLATVVTFRRTDPVYVVDLSEPTRPRVRGALKVPGFSSYLHPVGGDRLLGVGQDADTEGRVQGLQVSFLDISDRNDPRRTDTLGFGQGHTAVSNDSRAFTYLPDRRLAVLPASVFEQVPCPPDAVCAAPRPGPEAPRPGGPAPQPGLVGEIPVPVVLGVAVGADGDLRRAGKFIADSPVRRVLPAGERLVAVTANRVVLLDPQGLRPTGSLTLVERDPAGSGTPVEPQPPPGAAAPPSSAEPTVG